MITLKQYAGSLITPKDDAIIYDLLIHQNGIINGCVVTHLGGNQLRVTAGRGIIMGRSFVIEEETISATLSSSGTQNGRLLVRIDLANPITPIAFATQAALSLPALVQQNINGEGSVYEFVLATYAVTTLAVTGFSYVAKQVSTVTPVEQGGTGQAALTANRLLAGNGTGPVQMLAAAAARNILGLGNTSGAVPITSGGTGEITAAGARTALDVYSKSQTQERVDLMGANKLNATYVDGGAWTPVINHSGGSGKSTTGFYVRLGKIIIASFYATWQGITGSGLTISGIPSATAVKTAGDGSGWFAINNERWAGNLNQQFNGWTMAGSSTRTILAKNYTPFTASDTVEAYGIVMYEIY